MNITAANQFTPAALLQAGDEFDISVSGTFVATVVVQRSKDNVTFRDVDSYTAAAERTGRFGSAWYVRAGVKTGGFTSGTAVVTVDA